MQYILSEEEFKAVQENERIAKRARGVVQALQASKPTCARYPEGYPCAPRTYCSEHCPFAFTFAVLEHDADARQRCLLDRPTSYGK